MNLYTPSPLSKSSAAAMLAVFFVAAAWAGCSDPEPNSIQDCATDSACADFTYCSASGQCKQDCDPRALTNTCGAGLSCTARGRCVDANLQCTDSTQCDSPPESEPFCEGEQSVIPKSVGRCVEQDQGKRCLYDDERLPCPQGCDTSTGLCKEDIDLCLGKVCNTAPAPTCKDANTRVTYAAQGQCMGQGQCAYQAQEEVCVGGCEAGACKASGCEGTMCQTPPANKCADDNPNLAIEYAAVGMCEEREGAASCRYASTLKNCAYSGGTCAAGACQGAKTQSGQVIITEVMSDPVEPLSPFDHEWFELYNTTNGDIDLSGWTIKSAGPNNAEELHVIAPKDAQGMAAPLILKAGERLIVSNGPDPFADGVTAPGYVYGRDIVLFFEDSLELLDAQGATVDYLFWEGGSMLPGRSRKLDPAAAQDATSNDDFSHWCPELGASFGPMSTNFGSPGVANGACVAAPCAGYDCGPKPAGSCTSAGDALTYMNDQAMCQPSRFNNPFCDFGLTQVTCDKATTLCAEGACQMFPTNLPAPGQVIFTETLGNPKGTDSAGEWIELYNTTDQELALFGLKITDNEEGNSFSESEILEINAKIPAKGYAVFATNLDPGTNGGIQGAYELASNLLKNTPALDPVTMKSTMKLRLVKRDGTLIDEAYYFEASNNSQGVSSQLSLPAYKDVATASTINDDATNFCAGANIYDASKGKGTPGAENEACP